MPTSTSSVRVPRAGDSRGRRSAAFTPIELLATVATIGLALSLLLASVATTREKNRSAVCLANLKGVATASLVYAADDPREMAIPVPATMLDTRMDPHLRRAIPAYGYGGRAGSGKEMGKAFWGTGDGLGPARRPLNEFIYKDRFLDYKDNPGPGSANWTHDTKLELNIFRCPSDTGYRGIHYRAWKESGLSSYDHYGTSYAANVYWIAARRASHRSDSPSDGACMSNSPFLRPLSRVPRPSNTLYYEENAGRFAFYAAPQGLPESGDCGGPLEGIVHSWHGAEDGERADNRDWLFNVSFVDSHTGTVKMKGYQNPRLSEYPYLDHDHWRCVIIRGPGYQRDTLPSPPVAIPIPFPAGREDVD